MDRYHEWLGIPPEEQPPNHYRLLGISLLEAKPQVIESAVNQRMGYLQQLSGDQACVEDAQRIMGEISRARLILLNKEKKALYDEGIKSELDALPEAAGRAAKGGGMNPADSPSAEKSRATTRPAGHRTHASRAGHSRKLATKRAKKKQSDDKPAVSFDNRLYVAAGIAIALVMIVFLLFVRSGNEQDTTAEISDVANNSSQRDEPQNTPQFSNKTDVSSAVNAERTENPTGDRSETTTTISPLQKQAQPEKEKQAQPEKEKQAQPEKEKKAQPEQEKKAQRREAEKQQKADEDAARKAEAGQRKRESDYNRLTEKQDKINLHGPLEGKIKIFTDQTGDKIQFIISNDHLPDQINLELVGEFNQWLADNLDAKPSEESLELFRLQKFKHDNAWEWRTKPLEQTNIFGERPEVKFKFRGTKKDGSNNWLPNDWGKDKDLSLKKNEGVDKKTYLLNQPD